MTREQIDIYNELDNFVEENMGEVTHTEIAQHFFELGRNNAINKACEWLDCHIDNYLFIDAENKAGIRWEDFINDFREAMKGGSL